MNTSPSDNWNEHWQAYADAAQQNPAQAYRRQLVRNLLNLNAAALPIRVLELGCGQGDFARELHAAQPHVEYLGLDRSESGISYCRAKAPHAAFLVADLETPFDLPPAYQKWATHVVCSEMLEHVNDPTRVLRNVRPYIAAQGIVVITVPGGPRSAFDIHIGHRRHFTPADLTQVFQEAGFTPQAVYGAGFPFFNLYRLAIIASGRQLIKQAKRPEFAQSPLTHIASRLFTFLFRANRHRGQHGWQIVGVATPNHGVLTPNCGVSTPIRDDHGVSTPIRDDHGVSTPIRDDHGVSTPIRDDHGVSTPIRDGHGVSTPNHDVSTPNHVGPS